MKIAFLFGSLNRGGLETLMLDVFRNLKKTDFAVIALHRKVGVLQVDFDKTNVPLVYLPFNKNIFPYLSTLRKIIRQEKISIVHAQQPLDAMLAYFAAFGLPVKIVLTLHGFGIGDSKIRSFILKRTDLNLYVSNFQKDYYVKKFNLDESKQPVIYNGIDFSKLKLQNSPKHETLRAKLNLSQSTLLMGMVGNFNIGRDQLFICQFLSLLKEKNIQFHFLFIGKKIDALPERYDGCVDYCKKHGLIDNVSFLGTRNDVPDILVQLDAFVYATEHDTFGIAVVEAIASGVPVFVNDWEVMGEITDNGKLANLYKTDDKTDLLEKFMLFLQNKDAYKQKALENAAVVREKYSIEKHIQELKEIYQSL